MLPKLQQRYPELRLELRETQTKQLLSELERGSLDAVMVALPLANPDIETIPLFEDRFLLAVPANENLLSSPRVTPEAIDPQRLILLEEGHCFRDQALSFCEIGSAHPREILDGSSLSTLVQMVGAGIGVTLIPEMAVAVETRSAAVSIAHFKPPRPSRTIGMIWRRSSPLAGQLGRIAEVVRQSAKG